eukprot:jgi/Botrbrau1/17473/Bobra.0054s0060.1
MLNGSPIGGKVRSDHYYDLWTIKYLSKFKWDQLTEEINYLKASREQKIANEVSVAKREKDFYLSQVDKAKARKAQEQRRLKVGSIMPPAVTLPMALWVSAISGGFYNGI